LKTNDASENIEIFSDGQMEAIRTLSSQKQTTVKEETTRRAKPKGLIYSESFMDSCDSSSDDIYCTTNLDMLVENLLKLQPELQNLKGRDERPRTGSDKNKR